jgi:tRNA(fMet)-specific endonuclease VapC
MGVVLDSSVLIAAERGRLNLAGLFAAHPAEEFHLAAITASELLHGCLRAPDATIRMRRSRFVEDTLRVFAVLPFGLPEAREHARIWAELEARGQRIGERDLQIATTALANAHAIATLNRGEFERVAGLALLDVEPFVITVQRGG